MLVRMEYMTDHVMYSVLGLLPLQLVALLEQRVVLSFRPTLTVAACVWLVERIFWERA